MAKPKAVIPTIEKKIQIPADLCTRMELELYSDLEQKIPYGAQSEFINKLIRNHFRAIDEAIMPPGTYTAQFNEVELRKRPDGSIKVDVTYQNVTKVD